MIYIGIDPGTQTGIAVWNKDRKEFHLIGTMGIIRAMESVKEIKETYATEVRFEDARQRAWFGNAGVEQLQGAGSIKRDCSIWEEFLTEIGVRFKMVAPRNNRTKLNDKKFKALTKYQGRTSEHARDAAMLVFGI